MDCPVIPRRIVLQKIWDILDQLPLRLKLLDGTGSYGLGFGLSRIRSQQVELEDTVQYIHLSNLML